MDEMYELMKRKLDEMRKEKKTEVTMDFAEFASLYQLICYMKQIKFIVEGMK